MRKHIFCINGDPVFLEFVRELLETAGGYAATVTTYVPNAFEQVEALQPDLLLIDLAVGRRDGFDLLEQVANDAALSGIPVVVLSTAPGLLEEAHELRYSADRYLDKPFEIDDLLREINELLEDCPSGKSTET
jgi:DNA-binding response OmpR family regulator